MQLTKEELIKVGKPGDILIMTSIGFDPIGITIRWWNGSDWSHTSLYKGDGKITEAIYTGVHSADWDEVPYGTDYKVAILRPLDATYEQKLKAIQFADSKVGMKYDYLMILAMAPLILLTRMGFSLRGIRNMLDVKGAYICSELNLDSYFESSGIRLVDPKINRSQITPDDFIRHGINLKLIGIYDPREE
jgi:uncharacterized protein YycO